MKKLGSLKNYFGTNQGHYLFSDRNMLIRKKMRGGRRPARPPQTVLFQACEQYWNWTQVVSKGVLASNVIAVKTLLKCWIVHQRLIRYINSFLWTWMFFPAQLRWCSYTYLSPQLWLDGWMCPVHHGHCFQSFVLGASYYYMLSLYNPPS